MKTALLDAGLYPRQLEPKLTTAIWGGDELVRAYGKHGDPHAKLGESWECWDTDAVTNGTVKGSTVAMMRQRFGAAFLSRVSGIAQSRIDAFDAQFLALPT